MPDAIFCPLTAYYIYRAKKCNESQMKIPDARIENLKLKKY